MTATHRAGSRDSLRDLRRGFADSGLICNSLLTLMSIGLNGHGFRDARAVG